MTLRLIRRIGLLAAILVLGLPATSFANEQASQNIRAGEAAVSRGNYALAEQYYEAECNAGGALGCLNLAILEQAGRIGAGKPSRAMALSARACELGLGEGCANVAARLVDDRTDFARAESLADRACRQQSGFGCYVLSLILDGRYGLAARPREASDALAAACALRWGAACYQQGFNVAKQARNQADWQHAADLYKSACDIGAADGCNGLGALMAEGRIGTPQGPAARSYFARGCELNLAIACRNLAALLSDGRLVAADPAAARQALDRAGDLAQQAPVTTHRQAEEPQ